MSTSAGLTYDGERFEKYFSDFHKKYGISDMYSGGFYPYETLEEYWAWWSRHIYINRYDIMAGKLYMDLLNIVKDKDYFVHFLQWFHLFRYDKLLALTLKQYFRLVADLIWSNIKQQQCYLNVYAVTL